MKILVLGASGKTGRIFVEQALAAGHNVTAFVRDGNKWKSKPQLTVTVGDARNQSDLENAMAGKDAVVSLLGTARSKEGLMRQSLQAIVEAATVTGVKRVVVLSAAQLAPNFKSLGFRQKIFNRMLKNIMADKAAGEAILRKADLEWTIVYATTLDKAPAGMQVRSVGPDEPVSMSNGIARADVARFMLSQLGYPAAYRQAVVITTI